MLIGVWLFAYTQAFDVPSRRRRLVRMRSVRGFVLLVAVAFRQMSRSFVDSDHLFLHMKRNNEKQNQFSQWNSNSSHEGYTGLHQREVNASTIIRCVKSQMHEFIIWQSCC